MYDMKDNIKIATIISYITLILGNLISIVYTPYMLTKLGQAEYGIFSLVDTIISYMYLLDIGFSNAIIRYNSKFIAENKKEELKKLNGMFIGLYLIISLFALVIGAIVFLNLDKIFASGLSTQEINLTKSMFVIAIINMVISFPLNVFNGIIMSHERFVFLKGINLVRVILNPIIMVSILSLGFRAYGMVVASTIFNIILGALSVIYCFKVLKTKFEFKEWNFGILKEISKYSFFIFLSGIAYRIYWSTDQFILGMTVSTVAISIYTVGSQFNGYMTSLSNVIGGMFLPKITKLLEEKNSKEKIMSILIKVSRIQLYIVSLILIGFILVGKEFIMVWAGEGYKLSYYIALLIMIPQVFSIVQMLFATMLEAMNKHKIKSYIYLGVSIVNLVITILLVKDFGAIGCAIGTSIGMLLNALINNIYYSRVLNLDMKNYWRSLLKPIKVIIIPCLIGVAIKKIITIEGYIGIFTFVVLFTLFYIIIIRKYAFNTYEKNIFDNLIFRKYFRRNRDENKRK